VEVSIALYLLEITATAFLSLSEKNVEQVIWWWLNHWLPKKSSRKYLSEEGLRK